MLSIPALKVYRIAFEGGWLAPLATASLFGLLVLGVSRSAPSMAATQGAVAAGRGTAAQPFGVARSRVAGNYLFQTLDNAADPTYNSLTGINNAGAISGYYGSGGSGHPSRGYMLAPPYGPSNYTSENYPSSAQTQVVAIDNLGNTAGNFIDNRGKSWGFVEWGGVFRRYKQHPLYGLNSGGSTVWSTGSDSAGAVVPDKQCDTQNVYRLDEATRKTHLVIGNTCSAVGTGINDANDVTGWAVGECEILPCGNLEYGWALIRNRRYAVDVPYTWPYSYLATFPSAINDRDDIAGTYDDDSGTHGFVLIDPRKHPVYRTIDDPSGIVTTTIYGINDQGQLVGTFVDGSGNTNGFLATPQ
jgi:hypothetical protein